jgi:hypothetical protein
MFAYAIQCPFCETDFKMPTDVPLQELPSGHGEPVLVAAD